MERRKANSTQLGCGRCYELIEVGDEYLMCSCLGCWDVFCERCLLFLDTASSKHEAQLALGMADEVDCLHTVFRVLTDIENGTVFEPIPAPPRGKGQ
ncbi:MAG: hypothetical protein KGM43_01150 [Planctomycetota bacterium]|nr:hypothetical protein [Planctomycetota bacterium]